MPKSLVCKRCGDCADWNILTKEFDFLKQADGGANAELQCNTCRGKVPVYVSIDEEHHDGIELVRV